MALPTASDNVFPKVIISEAAAPASPSAGQFKLYVDSSDHLLKYKNSAGTAVTLGAGIADQGVITYLDGTVAAAPATPAAGKLRIYAKTGNVLAVKDDAGAETILGAGGGGLTQAFVGYNTVGGSWENMTGRRVYMKKVTLASDCLVTSIEGYVDLGAANDVVESLSVAIFSDNAGSPRDILAYNVNPDSSALFDSVNGAGGNTNARWMGVPIGRWLTAGDYWIAVVCIDATTNGLRLAYDGSGSDRYYTSGGAWITDVGWYAVTTGTLKYSIRANTIR